MKVTRSLIIFSALLSVSLFMPSRTMLAQAGAVRARVTRPVDMHDLVTLRGNVHPLARPEFDTGVAPDDLPMERMLLVLQRGADQEAALRQLLDQQQVKSSPQFHQWLTPEQFGQQFGPADSDLQAVTDWLASQGFQVAKVAAGRTVIEFSGTAGLVRQVLGTEIHKFRVNGEDRWANTSDPQIPAALSPVVAGFASLDNFPRNPLNKSLGTFRRSKATGEVQPLTTIPTSCGSGGGTCYWLALGPTDFATIYNVLPLWTAGIDGSGVTIAVVGETNINPQDVVDFRTMFGLPANQPNIILNGPDPGIISDEVEADLDVEWSGAVAKGATIDFVVSESTETTPGIDLSALYIIDNNLAPVMSESYGSCEASLGAGGNQFYSTLWEQAAAQGITVLMASGDSGSAGCDSANRGETAAQYGLAVSGLASTPFNVAVGGTDFNDAGSIPVYWNQTNTSPTQSSAKSYIPESAWNDSCAASGSLTGCAAASSTTNFQYGFDLVAGGGGPSSCINPTGTFPNVSCSGGYSKPSWQTGTNVPNDGARDIPDLSLFAGNGFNGSFYVTCQMDANAAQGGSSTSCDLNAPYTDYQGGSGTSASVQAFAGIMALVNQKTRERQGNANYVLYPMAAQYGASCNSTTAPVTNSSCIFYDVTVGTNSVICQGGTPNCSSTTPGQYGIMGSSGSAAYSATTGYDLAAGLGSVNVANLVNNWKSNFATTTATLALTPTPPATLTTLVHGQPVNFTVTVTSGSGTPTGDVSLIAHTNSNQNASPTTGIGPFTLSGGTATGSTNMLPGGSYDVTVHYAGNGTFAAGDSTPGIPVTVGKESSLTELRLLTDGSTGLPVYNITTVPYGSPYVLRMDVTNSSGQLCAPPVAPGQQYSIAYPCPSGALTVSPAPTDQNPPPGTTPGSYTLNSQGYAEDQPIQQTPGTFNFVASYAGDKSYTGSVSPTLPITITQAPTTTTSCTLPSMVVINYQINCMVTISTQSSGAAPTGSVQLMNNGVPFYGPQGVTGSAYSIATGTYAAAHAYISAPSLQSGVGTSEVSFQYSGDGNYATSATSAVAITTTDFSVSANPSTMNIPAAGQSGNSTLTITPLNGFTGTVNLIVASSCPTGASCTISPATVTLTNPSAVTATFSVSTTANTNPKLHTPRPRIPPEVRLPAVPPWLWMGLLALATLLTVATVKRWPTVWLFASTLLLVAVWAACGGGSSSSAPPSPPAPAVSLSSSFLTFGPQYMGIAGPPLIVTLTNTGTGALSITSITLNGQNSGDFAQTNTCGNSVAAGGNCAINLTFTPSGNGPRTASLVIIDSADTSPQTVSLNGNINTTPAVSLSPPSLTFSSQKVGTTSAAQNVTLTNSGYATLNFSNITIAGGNGMDFAQTNTCGASLQAGANCIFDVTFAPLQSGLRSSAIYINDNTPSSQQLVNLSGTATPPTTPTGTYPIQVNAVDPPAEHMTTIFVNVQ